MHATDMPACPDCGRRHPSYLAAALCCDTTSTPTDDGPHQHPPPAQATRPTPRRMRAANAPCWICGLPVDYDAKWDDWTNDDRFQEDHYWPVSTSPPARRPYESTSVSRGVQP